MPLLYNEIKSLKHLGMTDEWLHEQIVDQWNTEEFFFDLLRKEFQAVYEWDSTAMIRVLAGLRQETIDNVWTVKSNVGAYGCFYGHATFLARPGDAIELHETIREKVTPWLAITPADWLIRTAVLWATLPSPLEDMPALQLLYEMIKRFFFQQAYDKFIATELLEEQLIDEYDSLPAFFALLWKEFDLVRIEVPDFADRVLPAIQEKRIANTYTDCFYGQIASHDEPEARRMSGRMRRNLGRFETPAEWLVTEATWTIGEFNPLPLNILDDVLRLYHQQFQPIESIRQPEPASDEAGSTTITKEEEVTHVH